MICSIIPQERHKYTYLLVEAFLKCDIHDTEQAVYFIALDERFGVCGFAQLVPKENWELSEVHILLSENVACRYSEVELAVFAGRFYHELFEAVMGFAQRQGIQHITMATSIEAARDVENVGWPLREAIDDDCLYLDMSSESYDELLSNRRLFEQNVGVELGNFGYILKQ
ncbi:MAG: hypothetical protein WCG04_06230 [Alphaproteobacteria bacterium]